MKKQISYHKNCLHYKLNWLKIVLLFASEILRNKTLKKGVIHLCCK